MTDAACAEEWHGDVNLATMFCAGPVGTRTAETCSGDSGGPLLVVDPADHRTYQAGSTSFGAEDCTASSSVFARLSARADPLVPGRGGRAPERRRSARPR